MATDGDAYADALRAWLAGVALPGEADRLAAGLPGTAPTWDAAVRLYGRDAGDGPDPPISLAELLLEIGRQSRPGWSTAWAIMRTMMAVRRDGVHPTAMAVARLTLARERDRDELADPEDEDLVLLLARDWTLHARAFLYGLRRPGDENGEGLAAWLNAWLDPVAAGAKAAAGGDMAALEAEAYPAAWLDERDREVASWSVDGVPWLSHELALYLRTMHTPDAVVEEWLARERTPPEQIDLPGMPPGPALPSWWRAVDGCPPGPKVSRAGLYLARAAWRTELKPRREAERRHDQMRPEAGVVALFARSGAALVAVRHGATVNERGRLVSEHGAVMHVGPTVNLDVARYVQTVPALGTLTAQRFIRWAPRVTFEAFRAAAVGRGEWTSADGTTTAEVTADGVRVRVAGGWAGVADAVCGFTNPRIEKETRELVEVLSSTRLFYRTKTGEGEHPLLYGWHREQRGNQNVKGWLQLRLPTWWGTAPASWDTTPDDLRKIVPILPVPWLDRAQARFHAALAAVDLAAMAVLAERADDLVQRGGVAIPWDRLAREAGIDPAHVTRALDAWQTPAGDRPARWVHVGGERWALAANDETSGAIESLHELGKRIARGRAAGRKAAATKLRTVRRSDQSDG